MKGLLIKDFKLMKGQKNFFLAIVAIALAMITLSPGTSFAIGFLGFVGSLFSLSSISYDEFDNGNAFLFSLPITRKEYVLEKYTFGVLCGIASLFLGTLISFFSILITDKGNLREMFLTACTLLPVILLLLSIMLPFVLKFGGEKGRFVAGILFTKIAEYMKIDFYPLAKRLSQIDPHVYILFFLFLAITALAVSCVVSQSILNKKEF